MATKSTRSSGTQITQRGVNQGNVLVDPFTGLPVDVIIDSNGKKRLAVNADITVDEVTVQTRDLEADKDAVRIEDPITGAHLQVNSDGTASTRTINTFITAPFDYLSAIYPSSTVEVYTYKNGGSTGTIVGVLTITYTDDTKNYIASVSKS